MIRVIIKTLEDNQTHLAKAQEAHESRNQAMQILSPQADKMMLDKMVKQANETAWKQ